MSPSYCAYSTEDGQAIDREIPLQQSTDGDPRFRAVLATGDFGIQEPLTYSLHAGDSRTEDYRVLLKDAPSITLQSTLYQYPRYTQWADEKVTGQGDLKGLEGTQVRLEALANQPIRSASLELFLPEDLAANSENPKPSKAVSMKFDQQRAWGQLLLALQPDRRTPQYVAYQIRFLNQEGQRNLEPARFRIDVTPDLPPLVEIVAPRRRDLELAENDRLTIEIRALDPDFAIRRLRLQATVGNEPLLAETLLDQIHQGPALAQYEFVPRSLGLQAGDLVLYQAVAEDNRTAIGSESPDPNRQQSDPYRIRIVAADPAADDATNPESDSAESPESPDGGEGTPSEESGAAGQQAGPSEAGETGDQQPPSAEGQSGDQSGAETPAGSQQEAETEGAESPPSDAGEAGDSTAAPSDSASSDTQSESPSEGEADANEVGPSSPVPSDGSNDADAFERILEHLREQGEASNEDASSESSPPQDKAGDETGGQGQEKPSDDESAAGADSASDTPDGSGQPDPGASPDGLASDEAADRGPSDRSAAGEKEKRPTGEQESTGTGSEDRSATAESPRPDRPRPRDASGAGQQPADGPTVPPDDSGSAEQSRTAGEESTTPPTDDSAAPPSESPSEGEGRGQQQATPSESQAGTDPSGSPDRPNDAPQSPDEQMTEGADPGAQATPSSTATSDGSPSDADTMPGGQPAAGEASGEQAPTAEEPLGGDDPNLQFAEEATDLALEHLRDQQQNTELLERLGWTREQASAFLKRWEQLRRESNQQGRQGEQARRRLEDQLRGLGLRPQDAAVRRDVTSADAAQGLSESGSRTSPPPEYRDQYRAFLRSFSRQDQED